MRFSLSPRIPPFFAHHVPVRRTARLLECLGHSVSFDCFFQCIVYVLHIGLLLYIRRRYTGMPSSFNIRRSALLTGSTP